MIFEMEGSPNPSGKLGSQSHPRLSRYTEDNYTVVKCVGPGVANLGLDLKATTYQLYDPIPNYWTSPNVSFPVCKWDNHHSTVSQTWSEDQEE